jgi:hypothetical protein
MFQTIAKRARLSQIFGENDRLEDDKTGSSLSPKGSKSDSKQERSAFGS